jgi:hypothetical protein
MRDIPPEQRQLIVALADLVRAATRSDKRDTK